MIAKMCDICGRIEEGVYVGLFAKITYTEGTFIKSTHSMDICPECMKLIKELRAKQKDKREVTCSTCDIPDVNCHEQCREVKR